jgi:lipid-binding SYLF domain-containing protein
MQRKLHRKRVWSIAIIGFIALFGVLLAANLMAKTAKEIDASADVALDRFYKQVDGAKEFAKAAKGILVMPNVVKGAFIVGAEGGEGVLRVGGSSVDYYTLVSGSIGFQIGGQKKDIILCFMDEKALKQFRASKGWEAGIDGNVTLIKIGDGARLDTRSGTDPIVAFVFDTKGLIADISLKGAKFTKKNMDK